MEMQIFMEGGGGALMDSLVMMLPAETQQNWKTALVIPFFHKLCQICSILKLVKRRWNNFAT